MSFLTFLLLALGAILLWSLFHHNIIVLSNWSHGFDGVQFSTEEFYESVQKSLETREVPGIAFSRIAPVTRLTTVVFDERYEYLCVTREEYRFQVCAAPFGTGFFVSYWFLEREQAFISFVKKIPLLRFLLDFKTFYQLDEEAMYKSFVHMCVLEAVDAMTTEKGVRALSDYERRIPTKHT